MPTAYQKELYLTSEYPATINGLSTIRCKIKGHKVFIHSGIYDGEFIAQVAIPISMVKEEALNKFRVTTTFKKDSYVHVYSRDVKSLKATIRRNLKEQLGG